MAGWSLPPSFVPRILASLTSLHTVITMSCTACKLTVEDDAVSCDDPSVPVADVEAFVREQIGTDGTTVVRLLTKGRELGTLNFVSYIRLTDVMPFRPHTRLFYHHRNNTFTLHYYLHTHYHLRFTSHCFTVVGSRFDRDPSHRTFTTGQRLFCALLRRSFTSYR
uniref:Uncharacterized protein n=1 Tax=Anopheles atroparvus TaxID=41427 RepID=A0A182J6J9_ANOAO